MRKEERQARRRRKHADRALDALELSEFGSTPGLRDALASLAEDSKGAATGTSRASAATTSRDVKSESPPSKVDETEAEEEEEEEQKPRRRSSPRKPPTPAPAPKRQRTVPTKSESDEKALDDLEADIASLALRAMYATVSSYLCPLARPDPHCLAQHQDRPEPYLLAQLPSYRDSGYASGGLPLVQIC